MIASQESLDEAAKAAGFKDWDDAYVGNRKFTLASIEAHARTLDQLHGRTPPAPDPDVEALVRIIHAWLPHRDKKWRAEKVESFPAALAQYKKEISK